MLDHWYSNFGDAYKAHRPFGQSDHDSILLLPSYRQKLKQEAPMLRSIQRWSDQSDSTLQDCFDHVDWDMFRVASENNIDICDSVSEFIRKCIGDVVPNVTIKTFPNQKPWIDGSIRAKLKALIMARRIYRKNLRLKKLGLSPKTLTNFYRCTIESILLGCITTWYSNCTAHNHRALQRVVRPAQCITRGELSDP